MWWSSYSLGQKSKRTHMMGWVFQGACRDCHVSAGSPSCWVEIRWQNHRWILCLQNQSPRSMVLLESPLARPKFRSHQLRWIPCLKRNASKIMVLLPLPLAHSKFPRSLLMGAVPQGEPHRVHISAEAPGCSIKIPHGRLPCASRLKCNLASAMVLLEFPPGQQFFTAVPWLKRQT